VGKRKARTRKEILYGRHDLFRRQVKKGVGRLTNLTTAGRERRGGSFFFGKGGKNKKKFRVSSKMWGPGQVEGKNQLSKPRKIGEAVGKERGGCEGREGKKH